MSIDPLTTSVGVLLKYGLSRVIHHVRDKKRNSKIAGITDEDIVVCLELGRKISDDVKSMIGEIDYIVSYPKTIEVELFEKIAAEAYLAVKMANQANPGRRIVLILSGPLGIIFPLGQLIGLHHFNIVIATFQDGQYVFHTPIYCALISE